MRVLTMGALLWAGCGTAPSASTDLDSLGTSLAEWDPTPAAEAGPPAPLGLSITSLIPGDETTWTVTDANPAESVHIVMSTRGLGAGPCLGTADGYCLDVKSPARILGTVVADDFGTAEFSLTLPMTVPIGAEVAFEAVAPRGDSGFSWAGSEAELVTISDAEFHVANLEYGHLVITEVMTNPSAVEDELGEWFEVRNSAPGDVNLRGLTITDFTRTVVIDRTLFVGEGRRVVIAAHGDPARNGGLEPAFSWEGSGFQLNDSYGEIVLMADLGMVDTVPWDDGTSFPLAEGASMELRPGAISADDNDAGVNWKLATEPYGAGDLGTPAADAAADPAPDSCEWVDGIQWCYHPTECGQACAATCSALGLSPTDTGTWFAAQDTLEECETISEAFGNFNPPHFSGYSYACMEDYIGDHTPEGGLNLDSGFYCSSDAGCPADHLVTMDQGGIACGAESRRSICACE
jgi:hypothetical protein